MTIQLVIEIIIQLYIVALKIYCFNKGKRNFCARISVEFTFPFLVVLSYHVIIACIEMLLNTVSLFESFLIISYKNFLSVESYNKSLIPFAFASIEKKTRHLLVEKNKVSFYVL